MQEAPTSSLPWVLARVERDSAVGYRLEMHRGEAEALETAYVDVEAWEDRTGDCWLRLVGAERDAVSQSAAAWVAAQPEHELAVLVLDWDLRRAS